MRLRFQIAFFTAIRTVINTTHRMIYPFLGGFARGLGVDVGTISLLISGRSLFGLFMPIFSSISDSRGRRFGMLTGLGIFVLALGLVTVYPSLVTLTIGLFLALAGKSRFDPSMQAYIGDRIPYERRGQALAVTEMAWSMAFVAGIPLIGFLIAGYGWSAPFPVLAGLGLGAIILIWRLIPKEDIHHAPTSHTFEHFRGVLTNSRVLAGISIAVWASAANELHTDRQP